MASAATDAIKRPALNVCSECFREPRSSAVVHGNAIEDDPANYFDGPLMTCANCTRALYCSRECQLASWPYHKGICRQMKKGVLPVVMLHSNPVGVSGPGKMEDCNMPIHDAPMFEAARDDPRHHSPCMRLLGIDLSVVPIPHTTVGDNQWATYFMIDPVTGFAPPMWEGGAVEDVLICRTDGLPMTVQHVLVLGEFFSHVLDAFGTQPVIPDISKRRLIRELRSNIDNNGRGITF